MTKLIAAALLLSACAPDTSQAVEAECMAPAAAWCDANYRCSADRDQLARCMAQASAACAAWTPDGADAGQCAALQDDLACDGMSLVNDPESASCLRSFWRF